MESDDGKVSKTALDVISGKNPEHQEERHDELSKVATDIHDSETVCRSRDLINSDFARCTVIPDEKFIRGPFRSDPLKANRGRVRADGTVEIQSYNLNRTYDTTEADDEISGNEALERSEYFEALINDQYERTKATLKTFGLYDPENLQEGDVPAPTLEQTKKILVNQVTYEQLEVIKQMEKPVLQLIPVTSEERYLEALNSHQPMRNQKNAFVSDWTEKALKRADERDGVSDNKIIGWKVAITEGADAPAVLEGDDMNETIENRLAWFEREYSEKGISGIDFKRYMLLQMMGLATNNPRPLDDFWEEDETWTMLNGEPVYKNFALPAVAGGSWEDRYHLIVLGENYTGHRLNRARFRTSVMVDVSLLNS